MSCAEGPGGLTSQPVKVSRSWMGRPRVWASFFRGTVTASESGCRGSRPCWESIPSLISFNPRPTGLAGRTTTSMDLIKFLLRKNSEYSAWRDTQLNSSDPQNRIRSGRSGRLAFCIPNSLPAENLMSETDIFSAAEVSVWGAYVREGRNLGGRPLDTSSVGLSRRGTRGPRLADNTRRSVGGCGSSKLWGPGGVVDVTSSAK